MNMGRSKERYMEQVLRESEAMEAAASVVCGSFSAQVSYIKALCCALESDEVRRRMYVRDTLTGAGFADADLTFASEALRHLRNTIERERDEIVNARQKESAA
jgi:hypothetical protein